MFFTNKLIQDIVKNTNLYSVQKTCKSVNTNVEEIKKFIGMNIIMGVIPLPSVYDYWSRSLQKTGNSRCNATKSIFRAT